MSRLAAPLLALLLAACGAGAPDAAPAPSPTSPTSPTPSATAVPTPSPTRSATPAATATRTPAATALPTDLGDGRHYARLTAFDRAKRTLTLDVVQFLTGEAARKAAVEDGEEAFDYYVRNQNPRLRTLTTAAAMTVTVNTLTAEETGSATKDTAVTQARLARFFAAGEAQQRLFWLTLDGGVVTALHEQYLP